VIADFAAFHDKTATLKDRSMSRLPLRHPSNCDFSSEPCAIALQDKAMSRIIAFLAAEGITFAIGAYRTAPPGFRRGRTTVETADLAARLGYARLTDGALS
jgi:hypothetical protein